jgi:hypothetical protein
MSTAGPLAPWGKITWALRLVGSMNCLCIGRTVCRYCSIKMMGVGWTGNDIDRYFSLWFTNLADEGTDRKICDWRQQELCGTCC